MSARLTPWFGGDVKPVRVGVYATRFDPSDDEDRGYSHWSGEKWGSEWADVDAAENHPQYQFAHQDKEWRGLASNPAEVAK